MSYQGLFLADVDGTLLTPDKTLTERALHAIRELERSGLAFTIVSGRPPRGMKFLLEQIGLKIPAAAFNGGAIVGPDLEILKEYFLSGAIASEAAEVIEKHRLDYWVYRSKEWFIRDADAAHVAKESHTVRFEPIVVKNFSGLMECVSKLVVVSDDPDRIQACQQELKERLKDRASASFSQPYYVDVTPLEANKGRLVEDLCEILGIQKSSVTTIGDMPNDIVMFKKSNLSIAMGNSGEEVKKAASWSTAANDDEGFAKAVEKFLAKRAA